MNKEELTSEICQSLEFSPTEEQLNALYAFSEFMFFGSNSSAFIMRGSAGTGKTSIASGIVRTLKRLGQRVVLLAPTGRAAKVFALNSGIQAHTIHRKIYRQKTFDGMDTGFNLNANLHKNTLFLVDESSMIDDGNAIGNSMFGSGSLLSDLIKYVYSGSNCHLMLLGDKAQLPPVGAPYSPALERHCLESHGLTVFECEMSQVLRQSQDSGILFNATAIRQLITLNEPTELPRIQFHGFADIHIVNGNDLIEQLSSSYSQAGMDDTLVITRSNKRANIYNNGIRNMVLGHEEELCGGDRLMVVKNKYLKESFIANGDMAVVRRVRNVREEHGFHFADVLLDMPDYEERELETTVILDTLHSEASALTTEEQERLFSSVLEDYSDIPTKNERMKAVREDIFYNAMQVKYAYAVTCHKAQGGQWSHVYVDQGYMTDEMLSSDYIHWLYTAFTRATEHLFLVNWPEKQCIIHNS